MVRVLLEHGADADTQDNDFSTALHLASFYGCSKAVRLLLEHGANPNVRNGDGQTPLHQLVGNLNDTNGDIYFDLVRALLEHGATQTYRITTCQLHCTSHYLMSASRTYGFCSSMAQIPISRTTTAEHRYTN